MRKRIVPILSFIVVLVVAGVAYFWMKQPSSPQVTETMAVSSPSPEPTAMPLRTPEVLPLDSSPLKNSIVAAGEYLTRQQLENGELAYQVNFLTNDRSSTPSYIRLVGGTSALYTVCRVSEDSKFCDAGDLALKHYLTDLLTDPEQFKGTCLYTNGACPLGGATVTIDAIYKRWQATGSVMLNERDLLSTAVDLGYFIVSMRRPDGGFYHSFDPHFAGTVDPNYFDPSFNGEGVAALLELYDMTRNEFWLEQAHEVNDFMRTQPVTEDYGHSAALALFARLDKLEKEDQEYGKQIVDLIIAGQIRSLNPANSSISSATKLEALSALAQAIELSKAGDVSFDREIRTFITFLQARQFPANDCNFDLTDDMIERYKGGLFGSCDDSSIRVDGIQHWVDGLTMYLEYQALSK